MVTKQPPNIDLSRYTELRTSFQQIHPVDFFQFHNTLGHKMLTCKQGLASKEDTKSVCLLLKEGLLIHFPVGSLQIKVYTPPNLFHLLK